MKSKIFILVTVLLLVVSFIAQIAGTELKVEATEISPKFGLYGTLNNVFQRNLPEYAQIFAASKMDWHWTYYEHIWREYGHELYADVLNDAGKRVILDTSFFDAIAIPPNQNNWTDLYNDSSKYDIAMAEIIAQINMAGVDNLYAITIGDEQPLSGYWFQEDDLNVEHFTEVYNMMYNDVKSYFPNLRIFAALTMDVSPTWFHNVLSPEQVRAINKDGLILGCWYPDLDYLADAYANIAQFLNDPDVRGELYTSIWASTPKGQDPVMTPDFVMDCFNIVKDAGIPNIGFYAQHRAGSTPYEWLFFNEYEPDPELDDVHDPYGFRQVLLDILENSGAFIPGDANEDGDVNSLDITKVKRIIIGLDDPTPGADANGDGNINALDITQIELIIMGS